MITNLILKKEIMKKKILVLLVIIFIWVVFWKFYQNNQNIVNVWYDSYFWRSIWWCFRTTQNIKITKQDNKIRKCLRFLVDSDCLGKPILKVWNICKNNIYYNTLSWAKIEIEKLDSSWQCIIKGVKTNSFDCKLDNNKFILFDSNYDKENYIPFILEFDIDNKLYYVYLKWNNVLDIDNSKWYLKVWWKVFYNWEELQNVDYSSFRKIDNLHNFIKSDEIKEDNYYAIDKNHLFYKWEIVNWFNAKYMEYTGFWHYFIFKDDKNLYIDWKKIKNSDSKTFKILKYWYAIDKNNIYYTILTCSWCWFKIVGKNDWHFKIVNNIYTKNNSFVFAYWKSIDWLDPKTFVAIWDYNWHDKFWITEDKVIKKYYFNKWTSIYYNLYWDTTKYDKELKWVDFDSFTVISKKYAKDKNHVYYKNKIIKDADPKTFVDFRKWCYAKDKNHIFCNNEIIEWVDINTFEILEEELYTQDWNTTWIENIYRYAKDKNYVYKWKNIVKNIDTNSFELLWWLYAKDKNYVLFDDIISWADVSTFKIIDKIKSIAEDKNCIYKASTECIKK